MASPARMPDSSACINPCDESGSKAIAASPTANQPCPLTRSSRELFAATKRGAPCRSQACSRARVCGARSIRVCQNACNDTRWRGSRSASVRYVAIQLARGSNAEYHHPSEHASTSVHESDSFGGRFPEHSVSEQGTRKPVTPTNRSAAIRLAPCRRVNAAGRPVASITYVARSRWHCVRPVTPDVNSTCQPSAPSGRHEPICARQQRRAPACRAARASIASNRRRSRCQPCPYGLKMK